MDKNLYTLISQTIFRPTKLRFIEVPLHRKDFIHVRKGDVLGLYYKVHNPLPYSTTPCALAEQHLKRITTTHRDLHVNSTYSFNSVGSGNMACRQYSFTAKLGQAISGNKLIDNCVEIKE